MHSSQVFLQGMQFAREHMYDDPERTREATTPRPKFSVATRLQHSLDGDRWYSAPELCGIMQASDCNVRMALRSLTKKGLAEAKWMSTKGFAKGGRSRLWRIPQTGAVAGLPDARALAECWGGLSYR